MYSNEVNLLLVLDRQLLAAGRLVTKEAEINITKFKEAFDAKKIGRVDYEKKVLELHDAVKDCLSGHPVVDGEGLVHRALQYTQFSDQPSVDREHVKECEIVFTSTRYLPSLDNLGCEDGVDSVEAAEKAQKLRDSPELKAFVTKLEALHQTAERQQALRDGLRWLKLTGEETEGFLSKLTSCGEKMQHLATELQKVAAERVTKATEDVLKKLSNEPESAALYAYHDKHGKGEKLKKSHAHLKGLLTKYGGAINESTMAKAKIAVSKGTP